jgi:hypothetical protein
MGPEPLDRVLLKGRLVSGRCWLVFEHSGSAYQYRPDRPNPCSPLWQSLERRDALLPIFWGLFSNIMTQGRVAESLAWAEEMLDIGEATGDADLLVTGHACACGGYCFAGGFAKALAHAEKILILYGAEKHRHLVDLLNMDPKTVAGIHGSISAWMLGYPDRALRLNDEKDAHAHRLGHPFDLGFALATGVHEFDHRCKPDDLHKRAEECGCWVGRTACPCCGR